MSEGLGSTGIQGGTGGGAVTVADGADVTQGAQADVAWVSGNGTVVSLLKKIASAGGSAVSVADASDVAEGATTDVAVVTDVNGTVSGKLRGLVKIFADVWNSVTHVLQTQDQVIQNSYDAVNQRLNVAIQNAPIGVTQGTIPWAVDGHITQYADGAIEGTGTGNLAMGLADDASQIRTAGYLYPLSITADGRLRVTTMAESTNNTAWGSPETWGSDGSEDNFALSAW